MSTSLGVIIGFITGAIVGYLICFFYRKPEKEIKKLARKAADSIERQ